MTDPTLTEQLEQEASETDMILQTDPPAEPAQETPEVKPPAVKAYYKPNRHDRRKARALARKNHQGKRP